MEKHRCKLCHRNFANGRALGGHMRSHMMNLYASSKPKKQEFFMEEIESVPSSSSPSSEDEEEVEIEGKGLFFSYGMMSTNKNRGGYGGDGGMEADSDHFYAGPGSSVVVQDRESETESSKNSNIRRRSRRVRKSRISDAIQFSSSSQFNNCMPEQKPKSEEIPELVLPVVTMDAEPVSSISDTSPDEDVAHCLMMLSRDKWHQKNIEEEEEEEEEEEGFFAEAEEEEEEIEIKRNPRHDFGVIKVTKSSRSRGKYRCETCNKVFRSYQALGGHRASHKRVKFQNTNNSVSAEEDHHHQQQTQGNNISVSVSVSVAERIHECPVCYRVFSSGQALGGHKRSHVMGAAAQYQQISSTILAAPKKKPAPTFIDLNLPAPIEEDDDLSQIEVSAVSDADFVNPFKH
ncbi:OLC1v1038612C1 [Oldenlandia corymbosa var. corymbosa]|uniref:OLC1v1038612C1 n=1 Tax=Oldenlandia corymbosa var. corymbosa TaxID=529605 RepID=A0AAV1D194_OLDCO|nr:OLC1v1038612C1 [Oldenlandia corymbosa var. corymbosa]